MENKKTVALIYDFDGTLSPGNMQEFGFMKAIGENESDFWKKCDELSKENDANHILCYMYQMLKEASYRNISLKRSSFKDFGASVELYPGVVEWFQKINKIGEENGLKILHFINSSGLKEMIEGTPIYKEFENVYACSFLYNSDGIAYWPAVAVDYTTKTQFLFKINKGISEVSDTVKINQFMKQEDRPIPFSQMIYFGDGDTDIPSMRLVKNNGGHSIAVYGNMAKKSKVEKLIDEGRVDYVCEADYREDGKLFDIVKDIIIKISNE